MNDQKLFPSTETIRRMSERASALYEQGAISQGPRLAPAPVHAGEQGANRQRRVRRSLNQNQGKRDTKKKRDPKKRRYRSQHKRDTSQYFVNEPEPNDTEWFSKLNGIMQKCHKNPRLLATMRRYFTQWIRWLTLGLGDTKGLLEACCLDHLPQLMKLYSL
jgi:hypothetical protein